jgi:hypothetical protein
MKINFEGKEYDLDLDEITTGQAKVIKVHTGQTLKSMAEGMQEGDPDALRALYWLMHVQSGLSLDIDRADFKMIKFLTAIGAADAEAAKEAEAKEDTATPKE